MTRLKELDIELKKTYDEAYDLRVQADYGRESKIMPLDEKNMGKVLNSIREKIREIKDKVEKS